MGGFGHGVEMDIEGFERWVEGLCIGRERFACMNDLLWVLRVRFA